MARIDIHLFNLGISNTDITNTMDMSEWLVSPNHLYFA